jgi:hypothetical protein
LLISEEPAIGHGERTIVYYDTIPSARCPSSLLPYIIMSTELLSPAEVGFDPLHSHEKEEDKITENMEQEIECPRCNDIMTLSSNFDRLFYFCQECGLSLVMTS